MENKGVLGLALIVIAVVVVIGGIFAFKSVPTMNDIDEATEQASAEMNDAMIESSDATTPDDAEDVNQTEPATASSDGSEAQLSDSEIAVKAGNPVIATVDGKEITRVDVYRFIQTMPPNVQQMPATTVYPMAVDQVINTRLVQNKADAADIMDSEAFKAEMEMAKQQIARNLFLQQEVDKKITDSKLKSAYNDLIKKTPDVEERRARHILVETEDKAKAVIKQLDAGGDFEGLAEELSKDPSGGKGGDLGYFAKSDMVPEFANAAFSMKKGEISQTPVQTQFGWHVIKLEDVRQRQKPTYEQLKPALQAQLRNQVLEDILKDWREDAKIVQYDINGEPLKKGANATGLVPPKPETATN